MKVLVTGANGFVGSRLCLALAEKGFAVKAAVRYGAAGLPASVTETALIDDVGSATDWSAALKGADAVIHLAARVHVMRESAGDPLAEFRKVNTGGTRNLARQAAAAGIKRLVFLSTIKVNGERTDREPFNEDSPAAPQDAYAVSKAEAEEALRALSTPAGLRPTIIRTPLIYGPGAKGNLLSLMRAVRLGLPLPLKNIKNKRSLISLNNLADALIAAATRPEAMNRTFAVCDGQDLSTAELANSGWRPNWDHSNRPWTG
jgi:nucleoside-diphosphate-sugar epimerase